MFQLVTMRTERQSNYERQDKRQGNYVSTRKRKKQGGSMTIVAGDENNKSENKENEVVHMVTISDRNRQNMGRLCTTWGKD